MKPSHARYLEARAGAQAKANESGFDYGLEYNALFDEFHCFLLPERRNRYGFETRCEVVSCENLARCRKGHGP